MGLRRALFLIHRWLGIAGCLLVLAWFSSGVVMLYVPFQLEPAARLAGLAPLGRPALGLAGSRRRPLPGAGACPGGSTGWLANGLSRWGRRRLVQHQRRRRAPAGGRW